MFESTEGAAKAFRLHTQARRDHVLVKRKGTSRQAERQLRRICLGNDDQVERLITGELTRSPGIARAEAASRAVERYQRDNH
jgi:hypothetical protein